MIESDKLKNICKILGWDLRAIMSQKTSTRCGQPNFSGILGWTLYRNVDMHRLTILAHPKEEHIGAKLQNLRHRTSLPRERAGK